MACPSARRWAQRSTGRTPPSTCTASISTGGNLWLLGQGPVGPTLALSSLSGPPVNPQSSLTRSLPTSSGQLESGWAGNRSRVMERVLTEEPLVSFFIHCEEPCDHRRRG